MNKIISFYQILLKYGLIGLPIKSIVFSLIILMIITLVLSYYLHLMEEIKKQELAIENLKAHNKTILDMYDNTRVFRHDFNNFVQALDGYARANDINGIRHMCSSIFKDCKRTNEMENLNPKTIDNPAIYSIISNKYYNALQENITMNVDVSIDLKSINIGTYEFCKILGILLDNAIEAAKECDNKIINIKITKDEKVNRKLVVIENSYNKVDIDIDKIFEKGYTTKKVEEQSHGLGLWTVRKILNKNNNLNLFTTKGLLFCQQLEIYE